MTQEELAEHYGISVSTVKNRLKSGIALDAPLGHGGGRPKGVQPVTSCRACHVVHGIGWNRCPECGALTAKGLRC